MLETILAVIYRVLVIGLLLFIWWSMIDMDTARRYQLVDMQARIEEIYQQTLHCK